MSDLTPRERELVALGAAMGSNCVSCVEYHIPESRKVGLTDAEILAAIRHADKVRQVPARKTLQVALKLLPAAADEAPSAGAAEGPACGAATGAAGAGTSRAAHPRDLKAGMMSAMMDACAGRGPAAAEPPSPTRKPTADPAPGEGCGCG